MIKLLPSLIIINRVYIKYLSNAECMNETTLFVINDTFRRATTYCVYATANLADADLL